MWDLVGNPEDRFSQNEAHIIYMNLIYMERGSVEANFSLHGCKTANFTYFKKRFRRLCSVLVPESYVL